MENGSVSPDLWQDYPHHHGKESEILKNIIEAHIQFQQNDDECFHKLGVALHYIQDRWTLRPRITDAHTSWEREINLVAYLDDDELKTTINTQALPTKTQKAYVEFIAQLENGINNPELPSVSEISEIPFFSNLKYLNCYSDSAVRVLFFALQERPSTWSSPTIDYNLALKSRLKYQKMFFRKMNGKKHGLTTISNQKK